MTTLQVLPGSANLIGGRGVTLRNVPATTYQAMKFPGAPQGLKMACGENPKRVYGGKDRAPSTRMGNVAGYRQAFADAQDYQRQQAKYAAELAAYEKKKGKQKAGDKAEDAVAPIPPKRDLRLETLVAAMHGEVQVHVHCYRADEMAVMLDLAREFGFKIAAFHHGVEAYKIADRLAQEGVCGALWADWWGFKMEAYDGIWENLAFVDAPQNGCAIVHSDSAEGIQRLNQEAAKAMARGQRAGLDIPPERAIRWVTSNPAGRSASPIASARSSPARSPTSSSGTAIRSASTRCPTSSTSTAHSPTIARHRRRSRAPTSCSASPRMVRR